MRAAALKLIGAFLLATGASAAIASEPAARPVMLVIVGAAGEEEFQPIFHKSAENWREAALQGNAEVVTIGRDPIPNPESDDDRKKVEAFLPRLLATNTAPAWIVLIGHGTDDGKTAKFNLRGPDFSASELAAWLKPAQRPLVVVNTASSSGPFIKALSAPGRVVISATRSGGEINFTHFGRYIAEAIGSAEADLDKDKQTSLLEAFLMASRRTADFFKEEARLVTEHALLDDNGDAFGTPADWFQGVRAIKKPDKGASIDGRRAHQIHLISNAEDLKLSAAETVRRNELELAISNLRDRKTTLAKAAYYRELEALLIEMATLYETSEARKP